MKKNDGVICSVQSADRDEDYFQNPDKFDIHRQLESRDSLCFGCGPHRCQGEWLSRAELETVFGKCLCPERWVAGEERSANAYLPRYTVSEAAKSAISPGRAKLEVHATGAECRYYGTAGSLVSVAVWVLC